MSFLYPSYLWALLGLVVPIAIHLWSKKEGKTIKVGSIAFLKESDSKQSSSIKLNELLLLVTRLSLITILCLLLAQPQLKKITKNSDLVYIVDASLFSDSNTGKFLDSLNLESPVRLLVDDFPKYDNVDLEEASFSIPNYWQLAHDMSNLRADSIVVFTTAYSRGFKGMRPQLEGNISWVSLGNSKRIETPIRAVQKDNHVALTSLTSNDKLLSFQKKKISNNSRRLNVTKDSILVTSDKRNTAVKLENETPLDIHIFFEDSLAKTKDIIKASFIAISKHLERPITIETSEDPLSYEAADYDVLVWLSPKPIVKKETPLLQYKPDDLAQKLIVESNKKDMFYLTSSLNTEMSLNTHLPEQLLNMMNLYQELDSTLLEYDKRVVDLQEFQTTSKSKSKSQNKAETIPLSQWLWLILILIIILERILAFYRKQ